jgi:integrase
LDKRYRAIPLVGVGTGLRPEELFGLHRSDIEYFDGPFLPGQPRGRIHVQRRYTQGVVKPGCKTEPERFVAFGQKVYDALKAMPVRIDTQILFPAPRGGYIDANRFRFAEWKPGLVAAGLTHRRINDLRHTYASWMLSRDVPPAKLAKMMGTSIVQLEDTYHRFLKSDEQYGASVDGYGQAVSL